jgi:glutamate racemase
MKTDPRPIAVFDSGVGGLTVLKPLLKAYPHERFIYLGDTARLPYGTKSISTLQLYLRQMMEFLLPMDIKGLVIACHSASSAWLEEPFEVPIPVWEMISSACTAALSLSPKGGPIGLLATKATVRSGAYDRTLKKLSPDATLRAQSCPLFVPLIEEGMENDSIAKDMIQRYLEPVSSDCQTFILGCTHYPLLGEALSTLYPAHTFIDPAEALVAKMTEDLASGSWQQTSGQSAAELRLLTTDTGSDLWSLARRILPKVNLSELELVSISTLG